MPDAVWLNVLELSKQESFVTLLDRIKRSERDWKAWSDLETPEEEEIPNGYDYSLDPFK